MSLFIKDMHSIKLNEVYLTCSHLNRNEQNGNIYNDKKSNTFMTLFVKTRNDFGANYNSPTDVRVKLKTRCIKFMKTESICFVIHQCTM